jgi:hypothetical protein
MANQEEYLRKLKEERDKMARLIPVMLTKKELEILHWCAEHSQGGRPVFTEEDLELKDVVAKLEKAMVEVGKEQISEASDCNKGS